MNKKNKIITTSTIVTAITTATVVATVKMFHDAFYRPNSKNLMFKKSTSQQTREFVLSLPFEELSIQSFDGLQLKGHLLKQDSNKLVICIHGYHSNNFQTFCDYIQFYYDLGFNIFIPNNRAHGTSEGKVIGLGWLDRIDLIKWIYHLINLYENPMQIVLHGISMGSATVLMASGEKLPDNVKCIISDCGFTSVYDELKHVAHTMNPIVEYYIYPIVNLLSKKIVGYNLKDASTIKQVKKSVTPTLFIHGDQDDFVPTSMVYDLYNACNADKKLLIVEGAAHAKSHKVNQELYEKTVKEFIEQYVE